MNATNDEQYPSDGNAEGSDVPLSSNPGLHSNPVVHCQQETVVHDKDFGSGIRMRTNSTISTESYRSNTYHHKGDVGSEDFAKQFGFFWNIQLADCIAVVENKGLSLLGNGEKK